MRVIDDSVKVTGSSTAFDLPDTVHRDGVQYKSSTKQSNLNTPFSLLRAYASDHQYFGISVFTGPVSPPASAWGLGNPWTPITVETWKLGNPCPALGLGNLLNPVY